jgi:hypothetical protein
MFPSQHSNVTPLFRRHGDAASTHPLRNYARGRKLQLTAQRPASSPMSANARATLIICLALAAGPVVGFGSVLVSKALDHYRADATMLSQAGCEGLSDSELLAATESGHCTLDMMPAAGPTAN